MKKENKKRLIEIIKEIQRMYLKDNRPWIIGYSGGKDSTVTVDLVIRAILKLPLKKRRKKIHIISSNTGVENPVIENYLEKNIKCINKICRLIKVPVEAVIVEPLITETFWSCLIGKGYAAPQQKFRWCTDKLKIKPINNYIKKKINDYGEVLVILGVRYNESSSRDLVLDKHKIEGKKERNHTTLKNALVYSPIERFSTDDVWEYLLSFPVNIWGEDNTELYSLYRESKSSKECPMMVDKNNSSCGNSRFGCWMCTVVQQDKSLKGFLVSAKVNKNKDQVELLKSLIQFRDYVKENRNNELKREHNRQNGKLYFVESKNGKKVGLGAYNFEEKKNLLKKLLLIQKRTGVELIKTEELREIQKMWVERNGDLESTVNKIYKEVYKIEIFKESKPLIDSEDLNLLKSICEEEGVEMELVKILLTKELKTYGLKYKSNLLNEIEKTLNQERWYRDKIEDFVI